MAEDEKVRSAFETFAKVVGVTAVAVYVLLNAAYQHFYSRLQLSPEDLGIDQVYILGRALWLAPLVFVGPLFAWASAFVANQLWDPPSGAEGGIGWRTRISVVLVANVATQALVWWFFADAATEHFALVLVLSVATLMLALPFTIGVLTVTRDRSSPFRSRYLTVGVVSMVASASLTVFAASGVEAERAVSGFTVSPLELDGPISLIMLDVQLSVGHVTWIGDADKRPQLIFPDKNSLRVPTGYLGQSDSTVFLYSGDHQTVRLPASDVVIDLD